MNELITNRGNRKMFERVIRYVAVCSLFLQVLFQLQVSSQDYSEKNADAIYLDVTHEYILNRDGSSVYNYEHNLKLLTGYAFSRAYGESFVIYNPDWQELKVTKSVTTMGNGATVESPFNAYNEVLPAFAANAAPYSKLKEMVITHTGLEKGSVVNFAYTISTKKGMLPGLMGKTLCGERSPIRKMTVRVKIPAGVSLKYSFLHSQLKPAETQEGEWKIYTWHSENIPMMEVESLQPSMDKYLPVLFFTTAEYKDLVRHCIGGQSDIYALGKKAKNVVEEIVKDAKSPIEKALVLRKHIETNIGQMNGDLSYIGFRSMKAQETFDRNVGSNLDRAILLAAMCRATGVPAMPGLAAYHTQSANVSLAEHSATTASGTDKIGEPSQGFSPDIPCYFVYNIPVVVCSGIGSNGTPVILDPNASQYSPGHFKNMVTYYLPFEESVSRPNQFVSPFSENTLELTSDWILKEDGTINGKCNAKGKGMFSHSFEKDRFQTLVKRTLIKAGQGLNVSEENCKVSQEGNAECEVTISSKSPLSSISGLARIDLPFSPGGIMDSRLSLPQIERTTPIELPAAFNEEYRFTLHFPKDVKLAGIPEKITVQNAVGEMTSVFKSDGFDVEVTRKIRIHSSRIMPENYNEFRALVNGWYDQSHTTLILAIPEKKQ